MKKQSPWSLVGFGGLFVVLVLVDLFTKDIFYKTKGVYDAGFFSLHLVTNTGASFGILKPYNVILIALSIIVLGGIIIYFAKSEPVKRLFLVFLAAGTLGNLLNRITYGFVVDFIDFKFFPVFNVADSLIFVGVVGLIIILLREKK
jgi:signal peptidase II